MVTVIQLRENSTNKESRIGGRKKMSKINKDRKWMKKRGLY